MTGQADPDGLTATARSHPYGRLSRCNSRELCKTALNNTKYDQYDTAMPNMNISTFCAEQLDR